MSSSSAPQQPPHGADHPVQDDAGSIHSDDAEEIYEEEEDDGSRPMDSDSDDDGGEDAAGGEGDEVISGSAMDSLRELDGMRVEGDTLVFDPDGDMGGVEEAGEGEGADEYVDNSVMHAGAFPSSSTCRPKEAVGPTRRIVCGPRMPSGVHPSRSARVADCPRSRRQPCTRTARPSSTSPSTPSTRRHRSPLAAARTTLPTCLRPRPAGW
jgi:hypothetical protein